MRRIAAWTVTAVVAITAAVVIPAEAAETSRAEAWRTRALAALTAYETAATGSEAAHPVAYATGASAILRGWDHPTTQQHLADLYALRNPDGGWGTNASWDAFSDNTTNPATTTYTVTLAGHVGPVLLAGYRAGVVPRADVQQVISLLESTPKLDTSAGRCVAYSRHVNDAKSGYCVHNVSAGVGAFLLSVAPDFPVLWWLVQGIAKRELSVYNASTRWWPYRDIPQLGDADHNSYQAESMYRLAYPVGYSAAWYHMGAVGAGVTAPIAHMRLVSLPPGPGAMSATEPGTTVWCVAGDQWLGEVDAWIDAPPAPTQTRLAQAAYYSARAAEAC